MQHANIYNIWIRVIQLDLFFASEWTSQFIFNAVKCKRAKLSQPKIGLNLRYLTRSDFKSVFEVTFQIQFPWYLPEQQKLNVLLQWYPTPPPPTISNYFVFILLHTSYCYLNNQQIKCYHYRLCISDARPNQTQNVNFSDFEKLPILWNFALSTNFSYAISHVFKCNLHL